MRLTVCNIHQKSINFFICKLATSFLEERKTILLEEMCKLLDCVTCNKIMLMKKKLFCITKNMAELIKSVCFVLRYSWTTLV